MRCVHLLYPFVFRFPPSVYSNIFQLRTGESEPDKHPLTNYGLGICIVLLTIKQPCRTKSNTIGWNSKGVPCATTPKGRSSRIQPCETQYAISEAIDSVVGIGVPSKYFDLPVLSLGSTATVTLKRAKRVSPQSTKKVRNKWSAGVRAPSANAAAAGARPKEI